MNKKAFTLVELIVVITILAILGTIAIVSFSGYASNARDSVRSSDFSNMRSTLHIFQVEKGYFPDPVSGVAVTYRGAEAWTQGVYGEETRNIVNAISKTPKDPLTGTEYAYSRTSRKNEFELGSIYENSQIHNRFISQANAVGTRSALAYIKGNYNGEILRVSTGGTTYVLAVPSIINSDLSVPDLELAVLGKLLTYNNQANLPSSYIGTDYNTKGGFNYTPNGNILAYTGSASTIISTLENDEDERLLLAKNVQTVYSGSLMTSLDPNIDKLVDTDIDLNDPSDNAKLMACALIDRGFGTDLVDGGCGLPVAIVSPITPPTPSIDLSDYLVSLSPQGYWPLNETSGSTVNDIVSGLDGSYPSGIKINQPGIFDDYTGDSINLKEYTHLITGPNNVNLRIKGDLTVSATIKIDKSSTDSSYIVSYIYRPTDSSATTNYIYTMYITTSGYLGFFHEYNLGVNQSGTTSIKLEHDTPYHVVMVRDSTAKEMKFYVNGVLGDTLSYSYNPTGGESAYLKIGNEQSSNDKQFYGDISDVAIFNKQLNATEISNMYTHVSSVNDSNLESYITGLGPVAYYPFEETSGTTLTDIIGGYNGTIPSGPTYARPPIFGDYSDSSIHFSGNDQVLLGPGANSLEIPGDMSIVVNIKADDFDYQAFLVNYALIYGSSASEAQSGNYLYTLRIYSNGKPGYFHEYNSGVNVSGWGTYTLQEDTPYNVIMVRDAAAKQMKFYYNGVLRDTLSYSTNPNGGTSGRLRLGGDKTGSGQHPFRGYMSDVAIFDRTLTQEEITTIYTAASD